jgi:hypothetical protein
MNYEIRITENAPTWNLVDNTWVAVTGTLVELIVPAYSGYTTLFDRVACDDAEYKEAISLAHRYGAQWKQSR